MRKISGWGWALAGLLLTGCAAGSGGAGSGGSTVRETVAPVLGLRQQAMQLPGAEVPAGEPLRLRYAGLFADGAALPLAGGPEQLGPLADLLRHSAAGPWQLRVGGEAALARARTRLLQDYFEGAGISAGRLQWQQGTAADPGLELQLPAAP